jgi:hypothetical protein
MSEMSRTEPFNSCKKNAMNGGRSIYGRPRNAPTRLSGSIRSQNILKVATANQKLKNFPRSLRVKPSELSLGRGVASDGRVSSRKGLIWFETAIFALGEVKPRSNSLTADFA